MVITGTGGVFILIAILDTGLEPQVLSAVTVISPGEVPATTVILVLVEVPVQPEGIFQVYIVAPETDAIE